MKIISWLENFIPTRKVPIEPVNLSLFCWVFAKGSNLWWGPLKLLPNFHMKALFSSHNANNDAEIMVDSSTVALNSYTPLHSSHATLGMLDSQIKLFPNSMKQVSIEWISIKEGTRKLWCHSKMARHLDCAVCLGRGWHHWWCDDFYEMHGLWSCYKLT